MLLTHLAQSGVVVPDAVTAILTSLVSFLLVMGAKQILSAFKVDLSGYVAAATAVIVTILVAFANGLLGQIPPALAPFAEEVLRLIALLLAAVGPFGLYRVYRNLKR
jgi:hypothetical protein